MHLSVARRSAFVLLAIAFWGVLLFGLLSVVFPLPPLKPYSLTVEDREGRFLHAFLAKDGVWRLRTSPEEIPERLKRILVRREDRWFYAHPGVNPFAVVRALVQNARTGRTVSGASTITMQIARMLEPKERTYANKLAEIFRALQLECRYSKNELLEIYLSMVPLGGNIEGLKSASIIYYQTPPERLNVARLFDLMLIPGNPNGLQPDRNPARLFDERKRQAAAWIRLGYLSRDDSLSIWTTPAEATRHPIPWEAPHFCLRIKEKYREAPLVRSSLDLRLQKTVEALLSNHLRPWKQIGVRNGAVLVVDNRTKEVVVYAGSEDFRDVDAHGQIDAVRALRSPGSTLKPLLYAMAMDAGDLTTRSRLLDTPYDAEGFLAENYDGTYSGPVYADDALRRSLNVPMIRLLKKTGLAQFMDFLSLAGIASLQNQRPKLGLSLILGGCGVTLEEMTTAYAAFPSGGALSPLRYRELEDTDHAPEPSHPWSSSAAYMVTSILAAVDRTDVPGTSSSSSTLTRIAYKTGTSYGRRDAWSIGYSAAYTVGVWIGNVTHEGNPDLVGGRSAAPLLVDILNSISIGREKEILPMPADVGLRSVCAESGRPSNGLCERLVDDYYSVSRTNLPPCDLCKEILVSPAGKVAYCPSCLEMHPYRAATFRDYPAELRNFWDATGFRYQSLPSHNPACTRVFAGAGPVIVSPSDKTTYYLLSGTEKMALQAGSGLDVKHHAWYLDDRFLGRTRAGGKLFVRLEPGSHSVVCLDDKGRSSLVRVEVKYAM